ncbi:hypothetical protein [Streptomyces sp. WAC06128]|uniref:hypothetical protein n=1 Tax=Streptomyces sp. WAC06128 TaxID=2487426 RepID=UPI000FA64ADE|nr:hypothetical protein [Streptomyces sp. WAC06128]RSS67692.1 hypothetical protein EF911_34775 [Streptomyces sp. WAC06128]
MPPARTLPGQFRGSLWVGGADVVHGGLFGDAEEPYEFERVADGDGFVEDAVLAQPVEGGSVGWDDLAESGPVYGRVVRVEGSFLADQQVRVDGGGPALVAVGQPVGGEPVGELLQVEGVPT